MGKKPLCDAQPVWACEVGCDLSERPCEHLERLLPQMRHRKVRLTEVARHTQDVFKFYRPSFDINEFVALMRSYGFTKEWDIELLIAKYGYGLSNKRITAEQNYCSASTTDRRLRELRRLLKERGYPRKTK